MKHPGYAVWWSEEDETWLATEAGRPSGTVHGDTPVHALQEAIDVASEWDDAGHPVHSDETWTAENIRSLRRSLNLTQREFATLLNVSISTIRTWEQGQRVPVGPTTRLLDLVKAAPDVARQWQRSSSSLAGVAQPITAD